MSYLCIVCPVDMNVHCALFQASWNMLRSANNLLPGGIVASGPAKRYAGRITPYVVLTCIVAASGGALFGCAKLLDFQLSFEMRP